MQMRCAIFKPFEVKTINIQIKNNIINHFNFTLHLICNESWIITNMSWTSFSPKAHVCNSIPPFAVHSSISATWPQTFENMSHMYRFTTWHMQHTPPPLFKCLANLGPSASSMMGCLLLVGFLTSASRFFFFLVGDPKCPLFNLLAGLINLAPHSLIRLLFLSFFFKKSSW